MKVMDTIKTSALTLIVVTACLMPLQLPNSYQGEPTVNNSVAVNPDLTALAMHKISMGVEPEQLIVVTADKTGHFEQDESVSAAVTRPTSQADEWTLRLYPELVRIVELENFPADTALNELLPMLSYTDPVVRLAALESLANMNHPAISSMLSAALDDSNPQIRVVALQSLALQKDATAITSIEPYVYDREPDVRLAAIEALASFESDLAVNTLAGLLSDQNTLVRHHAVNALGEIGGEYAISYLLQARYDPDERIRANAEYILEELGG